MEGALRPDQSHGKQCIPKNENSELLMMSTIETFTTHAGWWSQSVAVHCGIRALILLRRVHPLLSFDPDVLYHIRTVISTLLQGDVNNRIRSTTVFVCPGPFSDTLFFKALYTDTNFASMAFDKQWRCECLPLLEVMPPMDFSLEFTLTLMSTRHYVGEFDSVKAAVESLYILSWCLNQGPVRKEYLTVLELILEELLRRAGLYASSIPGFTGYRIITALDVFKAIPGKLLQGHHLQRICDSYEFGCREWKEIMRRALRVYREHENVSVQAVWESAIGAGAGSPHVEREEKIITVKL